MNHDTSPQSYIDVLSDEELERKADAGEPLSPDELAMLVSYWRCPTCGKPPEAESAYLGCVTTGFHREQAASASDSVDDKDQTSWQGTSGEEKGSHQDADPEAPTSPHDDGSAHSNTHRDYSTLPDDVKRRHQFVNWELETHPGDDKPRKVPYNPATEQRASTTDSLTWGSFDAAVSAYEQGLYDGAGFVFSSGDPYIGIDLDDARDPVEAARLQELYGTTTGLFGFKPWAEQLLTQIKPYAYIAVSQSGTGAHVIMQGKLPGKGGKRPVMRDGVQVGAIEMYGAERFFALTGHTLHCGHLVPAQSVVQQIYNHFGFGETAQGLGFGDGVYTGDVWSTGLTDEEILTKARNARNGDKFVDLFDNGYLSPYDGDHSRADIALVGMLAFYCGPDPNQIDRLFRRSRLFRPKWDEQRGADTYGERTIGNVLRNPDAKYFGSSSASSALEDQSDSSYDSGGDEPSSAFSAFSAEQKKNSTDEPAPRFPVEVLPPVTREFVEQGAIAIGVPAEMVAIPLLVNAAAAIGNTRRIRLKQGYEQSAILFAAVIAKPGSAKTPSADYARSPLDALQEEAHIKFQNLYRRWESEVRDVKKKKGTPVPPPPVQEQFYTTNVTTEAIAMLAEHSAGLGVLSDELVGWFKSLDAYRKGGDKQFYLSLWAGTAIKVDRKTSLPIYVPRPAVSVFGTIQPDLLSSLADEANRQDGFLDRWLMVMPDAGFTKWTEETIKQKPVDAMTKVFRRLRDPKGYAAPVILPLSDEARAVFRDWYAENGLIAEASSGLAAGCAAKYPNHCARLALILHLLAYPDDLTGPIGADTVRDAIALIEYFRASLVRILPTFNAKVSNQGAGLAPRLRRILEKAEGEWVDRTTINTILSGHVRAEAITAALEALKDQGCAESRSVTTGGRPKEQWSFVPQPQDTRAEEAEKAKKPRTGAEAIAAEPHRPFGRPTNGISAFSPLLEEE